MKKPCLERTTIVCLGRVFFMLAAFMSIFLLRVTVEAQEESRATEPAREETEAAEPETGKIVWDIALGKTPLDFENTVEIISNTYEDLLRENIEPNMVLVFRGLSVRWLSRNRQQVWSQKAIDKLVAKLRAFRKKPGVQFVADRQAYEEMKIKAKDLLPGVEVVKNSFIALMRYHNDGYVTISLN